MSVYLRNIDCVEVYIIFQIFLASFKYDMMWERETTKDLILDTGHEKKLWMSCKFALLFYIVWLNHNEPSNASVSEKHKTNLNADTLKLVNKSYCGVFLFAFRRFDLPPGCDLFQVFKFANGLGDNVTLELDCSLGVYKCPTEDTGVNWDWKPIDGC